VLPVRARPHGRLPAAGAMADGVVQVRERPAPLMFAVSGNANAPAGLTDPAGAFTMTQPKQFHGRAYLEGSIASHSPRSISVSEKTWVTPEVRRYKPRRRVSNRGSNNCSTQNVPLPRGPVNAPIPRNGVGRQARVDPWGNPGAYTAGPTRTVQNGCARKAPAPVHSLARTPITESGAAVRARHGGGRPERVRAADTSRPGAAVMGRAVALQTCVLPTVENRSRSLLDRPNDLAGVGAPCPNAPIER
jgi:hypothetical protein